MTNIFRKFVLLCFTMLLSCSTLAEKVWIDVRTTEEFSADHISGDTNIPLATIKADELAKKYGKDAELVLYCRSGKRAGEAKALLDAAGFSKVSSAGGITDVRKLRKIAEANSSQAQ